MDDILIKNYEKRYKSSGPLRTHFVNFTVTVPNTNAEFLRVRMEFDYSRYNEEKQIDFEATEVYSDFIPTAMFDLCDHVRNDILMNNIDKDEIISMMKKIDNYRVWLYTIYKKKWGHLDDFFYRVYLWIRDDLKIFALYTGCHLYEEFPFQMDENWNNINIGNSDIEKHQVI